MTARTLEPSRSETRAIDKPRNFHVEVNAESIEGLLFASPNTSAIRSSDVSALRIVGREQRCSKSFLTEAAKSRLHFAVETYHTARAWQACGALL